MRTCSLPQTGTLHFVSSWSDVATVKCFPVFFRVCGSWCRVLSFKVRLRVSSLTTTGPLALFTTTGPPRPSRGQPWRWAMMDTCKAERHIWLGSASRVRPVVLSLGAAGLDRGSFDLTRRMLSDSEEESSLGRKAWNENPRTAGRALQKVPHRFH